MNNGLHFIRSKLAKMLLIQLFFRKCTWTYPFHAVSFMFYALQCLTFSPFEKPISHVYIQSISSRNLSNIPKTNLISISRSTKALTKRLLPEFHHILDFSRSLHHIEKPEIAQNSFNFPGQFLAKIKNFSTWKWYQKMLWIIPNRIEPK